jgi:predicted secreted protein
MHARRCSLLLALLLVPLAALADREERDLITLQVQAMRPVANDLAQAVLAVEAEDRDPARLADAVNRSMDWALELAREARGVDIRTGTYSTRPIYSRGILTHWRAVQELQLESREVAELTRLIGQLQEQLQVRGMSFRVSVERRREAENALIVEALQAFRERAGIVRDTLGAEDYRIVRIDIGTGEEFRPMTARVMAEDASMAAPAVEAGTSEVTVRVSGTVQLRR